MSSLRAVRGRARWPTSSREARPAGAGLRPGDRVVEVAGAPVTDTQALIDSISLQRVGASVALGIDRRGERLSLTVEVFDREMIYPERAAGLRPGVPG